MNNKKLKATYAELGIAAADVYEGGRIRNPIFHFSTLDSNESGERNLTTFGLITSFTDLITLPARKRYAEGEFSAVRQTVGAEVVATAAEAEAEELAEVEAANAEAQAEAAPAEAEAAPAEAEAAPAEEDQGEAG